MNPGHSPAHDAHTARLEAGQQVDRRDGHAGIQRNVGRLRGCPDRLPSRTATPYETRPLTMDRHGRHPSVSNTCSKVLCIGRRLKPDVALCRMESQTTDLEAKTMERSPSVAVALRRRTALSVERSEDKRS